MKNSRLRIAAVASVAALVLPQCGGESKGPPKPADPEAAAISALLATIHASTSDEPVVVVPGKTVARLQEELKRARIRLEVLDELQNDVHYYINRIIPIVRREGSIWLAFDHRNKKFVDALARYFLADHRVALDEKFGYLSLIRVTNELSAGPAAKTASLAAFARVGGAVTDIQFTPDGSFMLLAMKHGVLVWRSMANDEEGRVLVLPSLRNGPEGVFGGGESGLIGVAVHPAFETKRKLYTHYCFQRADGSRSAIVSQWTVDLDEAAPGLVARDERMLLEIPQPHMNHNAGQLAFGPDGYLYIAIGDGEEGEWLVGRAHAHSIRGKILRIDVDRQSDDKKYAIPADNPFVGHEEIPPETWAWGFRNPWRMSFQPDGRLIAGDIGEDRNEEITFVERGRHHGWPFVEGSFLRYEAGWKEDQLRRMMRDACGDGEPEPALFAYGRDFGMSVIAGHVYDGDAIPSLKGKYVFADYLSGRVWAIVLPSSEDTLPLASKRAVEIGRWPQLITTIGKHPDGNLYLGTTAGQVFRLEAGAQGDAAVPVIAPGALDGVARGMFATEFPAAKRDSSRAEIEMGRRLYSDERLSRLRNVSCATCHPLDGYGQDGKRVSPRAGDGAGTRNAPTTFNAHRQFAQFWDFRVATVEQAAIAMLLAEHGFADEAEIAGALKRISEYAEAFRAAFAGEDDPITARNAGRALGSFVRQLVTRSRWDDYLDGNADALTTEEKRGLSEFISAGCATCHQNRTLGGGMSQKLGLMKPWRGGGKKSGSSLFKVSPMLNITETAPYYHDGSIATLEEAVRDMADIQVDRQLTEQQVESIVKFLGALTGDKPEVLR